MFSNKVQDQNTKENNNTKPLTSDTKTANLNRPVNRIHVEITQRCAVSTCEQVQSQFADNNSATDSNTWASVYRVCPR